MKILEKQHKNKVSKKWLSLVEEAWNNNEEVPFGVIFLSDDNNLTDYELDRIKRKLDLKEYLD